MVEIDVITILSIEYFDFFLLCISNCTSILPTTYNDVFFFKLLSTDIKISISSIFQNIHFCGKGTCDSKGQKRTLSQNGLRIFAIDYLLF